MKKNMIIGLVLIVLGVLALAYEGISYMTQEEIVDLGPLELEAETEKTIPIPPIIGFLALAGGIVVVVYSSTHSQ
jgi:hypothetical protein